MAQLLNMLFPQPPKRGNTEGLTKEKFFEKISGIGRSSVLSKLAERYKLAINNVSWEDTGRNKNSSWGPNISDMTLFAYLRAEEGSCMPMIRRPNFSDITADHPVKNFVCPVGNEVGADVTRISLKDYLTNIGKYTGNASQKSIFDKRDETILTSVQYCVLPLDDGTVDFAVQLFNYQSYANNPAVLAVVVSQEGTSAQIVSDRSQKLYLNKNGRAYSLRAKRISQDRKEKGKSDEKKVEMTVDEQERNTLFIFQIPLKQKEEARQRHVKYSACASDTMYMEDNLECYMEKGMEDAIIEAGDDRGEFTGIKLPDGKYCELVRDTDYPIRCTIQKYKVTDSEDVPENIFRVMDTDIDATYKFGVAFGSLVVDGQTSRATEAVNLDSEKSKNATAFGIQQGTGLMPLFSMMSSSSSSSSSST